MPSDWKRVGGRWTPPAGFVPVTQLEHARLGALTPEMRRVAAARAAPDARAGPRRGRGRSHGDPRQHGAPRPAPRSDVHRPRQPHQGQRQHGRLAGLERHRRGSREAALGRALERRHRDGSLDGRRSRPHARGDRARRDGSDRHRADLLDDHRAPHRRSRRRGDPRRPRAPGAPGRRLHDDPRRRAARAPAAGARPADRHREPRRLAARQVDARARAPEPDVRAVGRDLRACCAATT